MKAEDADASEARATPQQRCPKGFVPDHTARDFVPGNGFGNCRTCAVCGCQLEAHAVVAQ